MTTDQDHQETRDVFKIPVWNLDSLKDKMDKMARRAKRLGVQAISYTVEDHGEVKEWSVRGPITLESAPFPSEIIRRVDLRTVTIIGQAPVLAGWQLLGVIEPQGDAGNIIREVPGHTVPAEYRTATPICDHCGTSRRRKETFLVQHVDTQEVKQVGRQCLADFLGGRDPRELANWAEYIATALKTAGDAEGDYWDQGASSMYFDLSTFVFNAATAILTFGWTSRGAANEMPGLIATASTAQEMTGDWAGFIKNAQSEDLDKMKEVTPCARKLALDAIEWARNIPTDVQSNYLSNLRVQALADNVHIYKGTGLAASLPQAYLKEQGRLAEIARQKKAGASSQHYGEIKKRYDLVLTVESMKYLESEWGGTTLHKMVDVDGNLFTWFSSGVDLEAGKTYKIRGTVKRHDEYKGTNQTILTRCKVAD